MLIRKSTLIFVACLVTLSPLIGRAQTTTIPREVQEKIRAIGKHVNKEVIIATQKIYIPLQAKAPKDGVRVAKDEKYGPDDRHRLDVYAPVVKPETPMPILMFIHGGGFVRGDKSAPGSPFYGNVGTYFARHGVLTIIPTYRLAPQHKWPAGSEDIARALKWVRTNGQKLGGDVNRVFLFGQSAGAAHVATYIFHEELQLKGGDGLQGAILMSGLYDPTTFPIKAYYGEDASKYPSMAAVQNVQGRKMPVFIITAEFDPYPFEKQAAALFEALCQRDKACPAIKQVLGHNHLSEIFHLNTADESIGPDILNFINLKRP